MRSRVTPADPGEVRVGSDHVTVRRPQERRWLAARILHREDGPDGQPRWLVLDRLLHRPGETTLGAFGVRGAVTSELRS